MKYTLLYYVAVIGGSEMSSSPLLPTISTSMCIAKYTLYMYVFLCLIAMTQQSGPVMAPLGIHVLYSMYY